MPSRYSYLRTLCSFEGRVDQGKLLIDADNYYPAVADLFEKAEKRIYIIGWDIDSRLVLRRSGRHKARTFFEVLRAACSAHPELEIYILCWNFSMLFSFERELWPWLKPSGWGERVHFVYDSYHPWLSSHHEKMVIIDEAIAFVGGIDFCEFRWDTRAHEIQDRRRVTSGGKPHGPFHDMHMMFCGPLVTQLCAHFRERWHLASKQEVLASPPPRPIEELWPPGMTPDICDQVWAVARTVPRFKKLLRRRENYRVTLEMLRHAEKFVYIENQYLTSRAVLKALRGLLCRAEGPEVICVLPKNSYGLLDSKSMGLMQLHALDWLRAKNPYQRLRITSPQVQSAEKWSIYVHSKLIIVDDEVMKLGSSNLNNRSLSHDRELDLLIVGEDEATRDAIRAWRRSLMAEHLGLTPEEMAGRERDAGSLRALIDERKNENRSLQILERPVDMFRHFVPWEPFFDPYRNPRFYHFRQWFSGFIRRAVKKAFNFVLNQR